MPALMSLVRPPFGAAALTRPVPLTLAAGVINDAVRAAGLQGDPTAPAGSTWIGPAVTPINTQAAPGVTPTTGLTKAGDAAATLTTPTDATAPFQALNTKVWLFDNSAGVGAATVEFDGTATAAAHTASVFALKIAGSPTISIAAASPTTISGTTAYVSYSSTATASSGDKLRITLPAGAIVRFTAVMLEVGSVRNPFTSTARGAGRVQVPTNQTGTVIQQGTAAVLLRMGFASTTAQFVATAFEIRNAANALMVQIRNNTNARWDGVVGSSGGSQTGNLVWAVGDYYLLAIKWNAFGATSGLSADGAAFIGGGAGTVTDFGTNVDFGNNNGAPTTRAITSDLIWGFIGRSGATTDADIARLKSVYGLSTSPKPSLRQLIQLIPTARPTFLFDGRGTTGQQRVAA